jgi:hypothetical protein
VCRRARCVRKMRRVRKRRTSSQLPVFVENVSTASYRSPMKKSQTTTTTTTAATTTTNNVPTLSSTVDTQIIDADDEMELLTLDSTDALNIPDFLPNNVHSDMETWSSGLNTPTHSSTAAWSTAAVSPSSSHISDLFMNAAAGTSTASSHFIQRRTSGGGHSLGGGGNGNSIDNNFGMIGKSAWGTDWFSPNPRLETSSTSSHSNSSSSFMDPANFSPASPFSFQGHLNHGVLDRYDLFPPYMPDGNVSEAGLGDAFGDDDGMGCFGSVGGGGGASAGGAGNGASAGASSGGTGFKGYHSQIAGDLISGDGARMHHHYNNHHNNHNHHHHHHNNQHNHQPTAFSLSSLYGTSFASGFGHSAAAAADAGGAGATSSSSAGLGLGLEGIPENVNVTGIYPMVVLLRGRMVLRWMRARKGNSRVRVKVRRTARVVVIFKALPSPPPPLPGVLLQVAGQMNQTWTKKILHLCHSEWKIWWI